MLNAAWHFWLGSQKLKQISSLEKSILLCMVYFSFSLNVQLPQFPFNYYEPDQIHMVGLNVARQFVGKKLGSPDYRLTQLTHTST